MSIARAYPGSRPAPPTPTPASAGSTAMAMSPATRATALLTPEAVPDRSGPTSSRAAVVTGATTLSILNNRDGILVQDLKLAISYPVGRDPRFLASADLDRDGNSDLVTSSGSENTLSILFGSGAGDVQRLGATLRIAAPAAALALADWNKDTIPDVALVTATPPELHLLIGATQP